MLPTFLCSVCSLDEIKAETMRVVRDDFPPCWMCPTAPHKHRTLGRGSCVLQHFSDICSLVIFKNAHLTWSLVGHRGLAVPADCWGCVWSEGTRRGKLLVILGGAGGEQTGQLSFSSQLVLIQEGSAVPAAWS